MEKLMLIDELFSSQNTDKQKRNKLLEKQNRTTEQLMNTKYKSSQKLSKDEGITKIFYL